MNSEQLRAFQNLALCYREFGLPEEVLRLEPLKMQALSAGSARVRMLESPVNPSDLIPVTGAYKHRIALPQVAGYEGVGVVAKCDEAPQLIGKRVLPLRGPGTWQRHVDSQQKWLVVVPDDIDTSIASRSYINPLAAMLMLKSWPVQKRRILVTAAGSSCAQLLLQWASRAGVQHMAGTYRSAVQEASIVRFGADAIDMHDIVAVKALEADLVFDAVGGPLAQAILSQMRPDAEFVSYGLLSGKSFSGNKFVSPQRFHLRDQFEGLTPGGWQRWFDELWPLMRVAVMPSVAPFRLRDWRDALYMFEEAGRQLKPVLRFDLD
jgi:NADPH:quinone reductase-like Zn-dependent oxidoreductase